MPSKDEIVQYLRRFFAVTDALQARMSEKWRAHSNRRTTIAIAVLGVVALTIYLGIVRPPSNFPTGSLVSVSQGASLSSVAADLKASGVIRSELVFRALVVALGAERSVHAGDYLFKEPKDIFAIAHALSTGAFGLEPERITIPEGATTRSMANILGNRLLRFDPEAFLEKAQPLEGYLFPDTYFFLPNATEDTVIDTMRQNFDIQLEPLMPTIASSTRSLEDLIIMASIIEKEAHIMSDRKMISGVLWNRIARGMPLQVDVTFLYTLGKHTFLLTKADLASDSPYNTYKNKGLPPTPINSPSLDSIKAALQPTKNNYLFYLADSSGTTHYSRTYEQHLEYKRLYIDSQ